MKKEELKNLLKKAAAVAVLSLTVTGLAACGSKTDADKDAEVTEAPVDNGVSDDADDAVQDETGQESADDDEAEVTPEADNGGAEDDAEQKSITVSVVNQDGSTEEFETQTDAEVLYDALLTIDGFSIDGYETDWGYYVTTVNGVFADYDTDGSYWSLYVNGEYGSYGVDSQPVADGDNYTFAYETYDAGEEGEPAAEE